MEASAGRHADRDRPPGTMTSHEGRGTPSPTPTRRTRAELRALLIDAALEVLREEGLGTGAEQLTFKRTFERVAATSGIRVTNASVIGRIWANQAEFQSAVLAVVASDEVGDQEREVVAATAGYVAAADRSTPEARRAVLREVMRLSAEANLTAGTTSRTWATVIGVWALASGSRGTGAPGPIYGAMRASYVALEERSVAATRALMAFLGLRFRPPFDERQFTTALTALVEGCALRDRADAGVRGLELPTGPWGALQPWTVLGVGMEALADEFFEPDPHWPPPSVADGVPAPRRVQPSGAGGDGHGL